MSGPDLRTDPPWLRAVRWYTFNFPIDKGKGRIFGLAKRFCRDLPGASVVTTKDGRKLSVGFRDWADDSIYFLGTYEAFCTEIISGYVKEGSVCFDVGANIGWYTTLFQNLCGKTGEVHSFEPIPSTFQDLALNVSLNSNAEQVFLNDFGLGDTTAEAEMYLFRGAPSGHASLSRNDNGEATSVGINISTLDLYLKERQRSNVDLIKVDIEGAELMFLKGAVRVFKQSVPPVILMEMSPERCGAFGYTPDDLIDFISGQAAYFFFALDEETKKIEPIKVFGKDRPGVNILCVPKAYQ